MLSSVVNINNFFVFYGSVHLLGLNDWLTSFLVVWWSGVAVMLSGGGDDDKGGNSSSNGGGISYSCCGGIVVKLLVRRVRDPQLLTMMKLFVARMLYTCMNEWVGVIKYNVRRDALQFIDSVKNINGLKKEKDSVVRLNEKWIAYRFNLFW